MTILFFDKDYNLIDAAWDQVTTTGAQTSPTVKQPPHDLVSITAKAPEAGYAYVFVSNEHPNFVDIYFDDVTVSHTPSPIVSVSDYFPFGLQFNAGERTGSPEQKFLYNGKELQDELSLNWYDYGARMYMPEIGRWGVLDPLAEKASSWTPYRYAFDNPLTFIDPDGRFEYSDGYTTWESRNSTGSISFSGTYQLGSKSIAAGSGRAAITMHFLGAKSSYSKGDLARNNEAKEIVEKKYKENGVNMVVNIKYGGKLMTKKDFYNQGSPNDSYVIIGTNQQLIDIEKSVQEGGWDGPDRGNYADKLGITMGRDLMAFVNADKLDATGFQDGIADDFESPAERLAIGGVIHELGHHFFRGHSELDSEGHHPNPTSIMYRFPSRHGAFNEEMLLMLISRFGR